MIVLARIVVLAVALLIIVACVYAVASIAVRMIRGQWLQRAGGFEPELTEPSYDLDAIANFADGLEEQFVPMPNPTRPPKGAPNDP